MKLGHYPCKHLLPFGIGDREGFCQITKVECFKSDDTSDCEYKEDRF